MKRSNRKRYCPEQVIAKLGQARGSTSQRHYNCRTVGYTRKCLAIEVQPKLQGEDIATVLYGLTAIRGAPAHI
jgi:hypothetical protein